MRAGTRKCRGYALVLVLWMITLLAALTLAYLAQARAEIRFVAKAQERVQLETAIEAGIWLAFARRFHSETGLPSGRPAQRRSVAYETIDVEVEIQDVTGLVNLNRAPAELLAGVFSAAGLKESETASMLAELFAWRGDPLGGPFRDGRSSAAVGGAKRGFLATKDELRQLPSMTDALFRRIEPIITVHGDHRRINALAAPKSVLSALPDVRGSAVDAYVEARQAMSDGPSPSVADLNRTYLQTTGGDIFRLVGRAERNGVRAAITAVIRVPRGNAPPHVLAWVLAETTP